MKIDKKTKLSISIITIAILLISVIAIGLLFACNNKVYADYVDIINSNSIVTFNQISNNVNVNKDISSGGISEAGQYYVNTNLNNNPTFETGHKFYLIGKINSNTNVNSFRIYFNNYNSVFSFNNTRTDVIYTINSISLYRVYKATNSTAQLNYYFNMIDLTLMFGSGNEPNLEQARQIFTSEYYQYTTGSPVALDTLNAYVNAYNDLFSSYQYLQTTNALGLNSYSYRFNNSDATFEYNNNYRMWYFKNTFATPLLTTLSAGTKITINYKYWASNFDSTSYFLNVSFLDRNNGGISSLYTSNEYIKSLSELDEPQTITFTLPVDIDTLYFNVVNNNNVDVNFNGYFFTFEILASQFDINTAIATAYQRGIDSISDRVLPGGDLYESIYTTGFNAGSQNGYIVSDSMSFVGQMFHGIGDILSMELIPNIPIGLFVALPLLVGLLFFIVKIAKGSGG